MGVGWSLVPLLHHSTGLIGELCRWAEKDSGWVMLSWRRRVLKGGHKRFGQGVGGSQGCGKVVGRVQSFEGGV